MEILFYILCFVGLIVIVLFLRYLFIREYRKLLTKYWEPGDVVKMNYTAPVDDVVKLYKLVGWNENNVFVSDGSYTYKCSYEHILYNKSATWKENYETCKKYMGDKEPTFNYNVTIDEKKPVLMEAYGKPIELMNETECNIYLEMAITDQNFEVAEQIRKRLENFK